jgi:hypothetical protein
MYSCERHQRDGTGQHVWLAAEVEELDAVGGHDHGRPTAKVPMACLVCEVSCGEMHAEGMQLRPPEYFACIGMIMSVRLRKIMLLNIAEWEVRGR